MSDEIKPSLLAEIQKRMALQVLKIKAIFELTCFAYEGVDAIKAALRAGRDFGKDEERIVVFPLRI